MQKFFKIFYNIITSRKTIKVFFFFTFSIVLSAILASKYLLFQNLIGSDGLSKRDIVAQKTIEVVDVFKTEQLKKDVASKVDPILAPAEDTYIKSNLISILQSIDKIRNSSDSLQKKKSHMNLLFDISDTSNQNYVINYFLASSDETIENIGSKAAGILNKILQEGITEKMFEKDNINKIIFRNMQHNISKSQIRVISALLEQVIMPNMIVDEQATEMAKKNAMNSVNPVTVKFEKGDNIILKGEPITKVKRDALSKAGYNVLELNYKGLIGLFLLCVACTLGFIQYLNLFEKNYLSQSYLLLLASLSLIIISVAILMPENFSYYFIPIPAFALLVGIFSNSRVSVFASIILTMLLAVSLQLPTQNAVVFTFCSLFSAISASKIKYSRRFDLIKAGVFIAIAMFFWISIIYLIELCVMDISLNTIIQDILTGIFTGFSSGIIVLGLIPILESIFGIITPFGLSELADHNQPLLKRLQFEAPGTFAHSLSLSNITEAIAEAIGANPILARVGALYHDVGKLKRPLFFVENQTYFGIENPHSKLNPRLSKMVIMAHPRDGLELAKEYNLPSSIQDFIIQHHGETLAAYFYNEAVKEEGAQNVQKEQFRYQGPKPNTKETAILMIADAVESASRTLKTHSIEEIDNLIQKIINERLSDGQLSDSPLTLKDLKIISQTLSRYLRATYHKRIEYHENIIEELDKTTHGFPLQNKGDSMKEQTKKEDEKETP